MTQEHDYKSAIESITFDKDGYGISFENKGTAQTILHALRLADKVTGEPSENMVKSACNHFLVTGDARFEECYKVMTGAAQKEIEDEHN